MAVSKSHTSYWASRRLLAAIDGEATMLEAEKIAESAFNEAQSKVTNELVAFYTKYAKDHQISYAEAKQSLNPKDKKSYDEQNQAYIDKAKKFPALTPNSDAEQKKLIASLKRQSAKAYVSKLQALQTNISKALTEGYMQADATYGEGLGDVYAANELTTTYDAQKQVGVGYSFTTVGGKGLSAATAIKWNGQNYSDKLWKHKSLLEATLAEVIPQQFVMGAGVEKATEAVMQAINTSKSNARRLVRTEVTFAANKGALDAYTQIGIKEYQFMATLDLRTSEICAELDNQIFKTEDAQVGVNLPPMHPYCRSTTIPWFEADEFDSYLTDRVHRNGGKTESIGEYMPFKEWLKKFAPDYVDFYDSNKQKLLKNVSKPPLDFTNTSYWDIIELADANTDAQLQKVLKDIGAENYTPEEIIEAWAEKEKNKYSNSATFNRTQFLNRSDVLKSARNMGMMSKDSLTYGGHPKTVEASFFLDKHLDGLTQTQAFNRLFTGKPVDSIYDVMFGQPPSGVTDSYKDYMLQLGRNGMNTAARMMNDKTGKRYSADDMLEYLTKFTDAIEPGTHNLTWVERYSKKTSFYYESELYQTYRKAFKVEGISAEYLAKVIKGKYDTIGEAAVVYQQKEAQYAAKAKSSAYSYTSSYTSYSHSQSQSTMVNVDLTAEEEKLAKSKLEFWDEFGDPIAYQEMLDEAKMPPDAFSADTKYRPSASVFWKNSTRAQREALYNYTRGSGQFNRPLEGYETNGGWYSSSHHPDWKLDQFQNSQAIFDAYDGVDHSVLTEHTRVRRGGSINELFGDTTSMFPDVRTFSALKSKIGGVVQINRFLSTGVAPGRGFGGQFSYEIVLPKGTHAIYVEPFSAYGAGSGLNWNGDPTPTRSLGSEQEMVIQAGTQYIIQDVDDGNRKVTLVAIPASQRVLPPKLKESSLAATHVKNK